MANLQYLIALIVSIILLIYLITMIIKKNNGKGQIRSMFLLCLFFMMLWTFSLILQILFQNKNVNPVLFEGFASFGACFVPVTFMLFGMAFSKTKLKINSSILFLYIIPVVSTILMFTNSQHHLMYVQYSLKFRETVFGKYFTIHSIYSYACIFIGLWYLLKYMFRNSGFFSKQSLLVLSGVAITVGINIIATFGILDLNVYATPISFTISFIFFALAIFKLDFLRVTPIALQRIVDRISDSYMVLNDDMVITDFNKTLLDTFSTSSSDIRNINIIDLLAKNPKLNVDVERLIAAVNKTKMDESTVVLEQHFKSIDKYFHIEINSIKQKNTYLGTLILLKDITQHTHDMQTIKDNQDILIEKERLASLGQMIGGIAHNLKTPIMSIAGAAEGLSDLTNEYRNSVGDPDVTVEDHHAIANDMDEWIAKIRTHLSYMSDIITAVKGQAVAFSDNMINGFTVQELVKHVDILMKHELKNALITMNTNVKLDENTQVGGNINSLVQVINNIISNAIQAYNGKENETINFTLEKRNNRLLISIEDFAGGLPKTVEEKMFKEMVTTKGKNGTGLGMFMSYSNIKAHFNGNMSYITEKGKGTTFFIEIPLES